MTDIRSRPESAADSPAPPASPPAPSRGVVRAEATSPVVDDATDPRRTRHPRRVAALIAVVGLVLTLGSAWAAARIDRNTQQSLLEGQTRQAAEVLSSAIMVIQQPLQTVIALQRVAGDSEDPTAFRSVMAASVGPGKTFQTASLWHQVDGSLHQVSSIGVRPAMRPDAPETLAHLRDAFDSKTTTVRSVTAGDRNEIVYVLGDAATGWLVYAERMLPADRRAPVDSNSAFRELHYAIYLGPRVETGALSTTDVDPTTLPLDGITARQTVPFGDNVLTLTTTPRHHLGSDLSHRLPWLLLVVGVLMTAVATRAGQQLARGRQTAEADAATITELYERTETLFGQQRELFVSLQRALLPHANPRIPNLELASRYVAGARGLDIGGDWYSIIDLENGKYGFVVGDVSGRGVDAVAVMAHARFAIRAYLIEGDDPARVLEKCAPQFDIVNDGHMTTALVGVGDWRTGEVTLASAGHPPPALVTDAGTSYVEISPGRPLGTGLGGYPTTVFTMPAGSTLFCYTDGLVERRDEDIDAGLERLSRLLAETADLSVDHVVTHAVETLRHQDAPDDIATLAIRWTGR